MCVLFCFTFSRCHFFFPFLQAFVVSMFIYTPSDMDFDQLQELHTYKGKVSKAGLREEKTAVSINVLNQKNWEEVSGGFPILFFISFSVIVLIIFSGLYVPSRMHCREQLRFWKPILLRYLTPFVNFCVLICATFSITFNLIFSLMLSASSRAVPSCDQHRLLVLQDDSHGCITESLENPLTDRSPTFSIILETFFYLFYFFQLLGLIGIWLLLVWSKSIRSGRILIISGVTFYFVPSFVDVLFSYYGNLVVEKVIRNNKLIIFIHSIFCAISFLYPLLRRELSAIKQTMDGNAVDILRKRQKELMQLRQMRYRIPPRKRQ